MRYVYFIQGQESNRVKIGISECWLRLGVSQMRKYFEVQSRISPGRRIKSWDKESTVLTSHWHAICYDT